MRLITQIHEQGRPNRLAFATVGAPRRSSTHKPVGPRKVEHCRQNTQEQSTAPYMHFHRKSDHTLP